MRYALGHALCFWALWEPGHTLAQAPVPLAPRNRLSAGFALDLPTLARITQDPQQPVTATAERTTTGELFLGYERDLGYRTTLGLSGQFMSVPMAFGFDEYKLTDTLGGITGPTGRGSMRLGDWSRFGLQCDFVYLLSKSRRWALSTLVGGRMVVLPQARISYTSGVDVLYETRLRAVHVVGRYEERFSFGAVGGVRLATRSKNDNGIHLTLVGAWYPQNAFTGTLYTLPGTSQERRANFTQGQSFIGLSVAIYKSWGPPKVPMRLRKDREP